MILEPCLMRGRDFDKMRHAEEEAQVEQSLMVSFGAQLAEHNF